VMSVPKIGGTPSTLMSYQFSSGWPHGGRGEYLLEPTRRWAAS
jgi:hypothetical protein